jgi:hypothetical protein
VEVGQDGEKVQVRSRRMGVGILQSRRTRPSKASQNQDVGSELPCRFQHHDSFTGSSRESQHGLGNESAVPVPFVIGGGSAGRRLSLSLASLLYIVERVIRQGFGFGFRILYPLIPRPHYKSVELVTHSPLLSDVSHVSRSEIRSHTLAAKNGMCLNHGHVSGR